MTYSCSDLSDTVVQLLTQAGYTVHTDQTEHLPVPGPVPEEGWWFCWTDGNVDVESGPTVESELLAWVSALEHWFENAKIPVHTGPTSNLAIADVLVLLDQKCNASFACGSWDPNESDDPYSVLYAESEAIRVELEAAINELFQSKAALLAALDEAREGLLWYQDRNPGQRDGSDDEAMARIDAAIAQAGGVA